MNVHIDILHSAHINLFKNLINKYSDKYNFIITCIDRGKVPRITKEEIKSVPVFVIGKHRGTKFSIIFQANILRFFQLFWFLRNKKIDFGISFGSFLAGAIVRLRGKPYVHLNDDPERKMNALLENLTGTARYLPPIVKEKGKIKTFNALKEWSYLSPTYFKPNNRILEPYNINPKQYIFIREVSTGSLNYQGQQKNIIATFGKDLPSDYKIVLSLEDKSTINQYPLNWVLLKEPVSDIHSIIYYSALVISSGDSMAREGAMLGVPSIYCGFREMEANNLLIKKNILFKVHPQKTIEFIINYFKNTKNKLAQDKIRSTLLKEWIDLNRFLSDLLIDYNRKSKSSN